MILDIFSGIYDLGKSAFKDLDGLDATFLYSINNAKDTVWGNNGALSPILTAAISLAAFFVCISLITLTKNYVDGKEYKYSDIFKPIMIFVFVASFKVLVLFPIDYISNSYATQLAAKSETSCEQFYVNMMETMKSNIKGDKPDNKVPELTPEQVASMDWLNKFIYNFNSLLVKINNFLSFSWLGDIMNISGSMFTGLVFSFVYIYMYIISQVLVILGGFFQILLGLVGPFTFAISILPTYRSGIKLWIERYVQFSLWAPVTYLTLYLVNTVMIQSCDLSKSGFIFSDAMMASIFIGIAGTFALLQVPQTASFIIESSSNGSIGDNNMIGAIRKLFGRR